MTEAVKKKKAKEIKIYRKACKACGICTAFCPTKCIVQDQYGYPVVKCLEDCIACDLCSDRCPDLAIEIMKENNNDK